MAMKTGSVWAIDIGNNALKALRLSSERGVVEVVGFENIRHSKVLTGTGVGATESAELIAISLRQFISRNNLSRDDIIISVPSQNSFARFVNLPPVESKRIPEIVNFEATQQIPFDISDVQWDWQLMEEGDAGKAKVGIFAIKNDVVNSTLEHFNRENVQVGYVQMAPMALYNYILYDRPDLTKSDNQATIVLEIGAENTDLVVCTKSAVWQRCILMGGNTFTKAIADAFKINFEKAEKLKRTAPMSKYARQIFQAMRPIFADLASEIQRSLGFYSSSHANTKFIRIIALGGGTKLRGLLKYLSQRLQVPVERPDSFKRIAINPSISAAKFHENVGDFGIVYGLGLQGLGLARIESNLLPRRIARTMAWAGKARYFTAAAGVIVLISVLAFARTIFDKASYSAKAQTRRRITEVINDAKEASRKLEDEQSKQAVYEALIQKEFDLFKYRDVIPLLHQTIISTLPNEENNPEQKELYRAFARGDIKGVLEVPRSKRKQIFITSMSIRFVGDVGNAQFGETGLQRWGGSGRVMPEVVGTPRIRPTPTTTVRPGQAGTTGTAEAEQQKPGTSTGFVVTVAGYSPYENINELISPIGVGNDKSRWGVVTRLMHLDDMFDGNSPFELYEKGNIEHFRPITRPVDSADSEMPPGIGIVDIQGVESASRGSLRWAAARGDSDRRLIDPMTKEVISRVVELDKNGKPKLDRRGKRVYKVNDHWFVLNFKLLWKDAPVKSQGGI